MFFDPEGQKDRGFGSAIRLELLRNISEEELANILGVAPPYIVNAEGGRPTANSKIIHKLCKFFNITG